MMTLETLAQLREDRAFAKSKMAIAEETNNQEMYEKYAQMFDETTKAIQELRKSMGV